MLPKMDSTAGTFVQHNSTAQLHKGYNSLTNELAQTQSITNTRADDCDRPELTTYTSIPTTAARGCWLGIKHTVC